jgi:hypothetical protein
MTTLTLPTTAQAFVVPADQTAEEYFHFLVGLDHLLENVRAARELWSDPTVQAALTDVERFVLSHI